MTRLSSKSINKQPMRFWRYFPLAGVILTSLQPLKSQTISASPIPAIITDGSGLAVTTIIWSASNVVSQTIGVYIGPGTQKLFCDSGAGGANGTCVTGEWVTNGMVFVLANESTKQILAQTTVTTQSFSVVTSPPDAPVAAGGCFRIS